MTTNRSLLFLAAGSLAALCFALLFVFHFSVKAAGDASWGFSLSNLDRTCKACDDFYEFAMGGWMQANPIPAEYPSWGPSTQLRDNNLTAMHTILEAAATAKAAAGSNEKKIGDFYPSCMETAAIDPHR